MDAADSKNRDNEAMGKYRAAIFMAVLAIICLVIHFYTGWEADIDEAAAHGESAQMNEYVVQWTRDTFENLQSEFWQLAFQFALLAGFFEFIHVKAYEDDEENMKQRLERIEQLLTERR
jgi:sensor domain CHASE-containing protein